jgi:hypothetical protein
MFRGMDEIDYRKGPKDRARNGFMNKECPCYACAWAPRQTSRRLPLTKQTAQIRHEALRLQRFELSTVEPRVMTLRAQIHHHLLVAFTPHLFHRDITRRAPQRLLLMRLVRNVMPLEKDVVVLDFDLFEILSADEGAFACFTNVNLLENGMVRKTPAHERLLTTRTFHGHDRSVSRDERRLSSLN